MNDIEKLRLRRLDMTQLLIFSELMLHKKQTVVAEKLGLTQSAISHGLKRLREIFEDELFIRKSDGIEPTARAVLLEPRVLEILQLSRNALSLDQDFDPAREKRVVRLGGLDYEATVFTTPIMKMLGEEAPGIRVSFRSTAREAALKELGEGSIDIALGYFWGLQKPFEKIDLFDESYVILAREKHPLLTRELTLERYCEARHLLVSIAGDLHGIVDKTLAKNGLTRNVAGSVPLFFPALATVAQTDLITTIPTRLAHQFAERFALKIMEPPLKLRKFTIGAVWHQRTDTDPALRWFRDKLRGLMV